MLYKHIKHYETFNNCLDKSLCQTGIQNKHYYKTPILLTWLKSNRKIIEK